MTQNEKLYELLDTIKELEEWVKDLAVCPQSEEKKSPVEEPNDSTSSSEPISSIPLQAPKQHKNATLKVVENPLTRQSNLVYSYTSSDGQQKDYIFLPKPEPTPLEKWLDKYYPRTANARPDYNPSVYYYYPPTYTKKK